MNRTGIAFALAAAGAVGLAAAIAAQGTAKVPGNIWPPAKKQMEKSIALSPEEEMKTFSMPPGYRVELVASEPMIESPILMDFDADGRLWVLEMLTFLPDTSGRDSREPLNRVSVLEDTNGDGKMDKKTVFADKLVMPRALKVLDHGVLVGEPPNLWLMKDTDGDLKADTKELVVNTYGNPNGGIEHNANSLFWAMDNVMYSSEHVWDLRWRNGKFESLPALSRGQWQISQDDAGRIYRNVNDSPLFVDYTPSRYFLRNPNGARTRGLYELLIEQTDATVYPVRDNRGVNRGYRDPFFRAGRDRRSSFRAPAGRPSIAATPIPRSCTATRSSPTRRPISCTGWWSTDDGSGRLTAKNGYAQGEFLASSDERFRPVSLFDGPDGNMYVVDMYRGVVQAGGIWSEYLTDYIKAHEMELPVGRGRIWRVVYGHGAGAASRRAGAVEGDAAAAGADAVESEGLVARHGAAAARRARRRVRRAGAEDAGGNGARLAHEAARAVDARRARRDRRRVGPEGARRRQRRRPRGRRAAVRAVARPGRGAQGRRGRARSTTRTGTCGGRWPRRSARCRRRIASRRRSRCSRATATDPIIVDAAISSLKGLEADVLTAVMQAKTVASASPTEAVAMLAAAVAKSGDVAAVQRVIDVIADASQPEWQRTALLQGLDAGLPVLGAAPRLAGGRGGGGGGGLPGLSAPGGRVAVTPGRGVSLPGRARRADEAGGGHGRDRAPREECVGEARLAGAAGARRHGGAAHRRAAEAFRCGRRDLQEHLPGLPPGRRARQGEARRESRRLAVCDRRRRVGDDSDSGRRQGRADRPDAAARTRVDRRADCRGAHLRPPRVGPHGIGRRSAERHGSARPVEGPHAAWSDDELKAAAGRGGRGGGGGM